MKRLIVVAFTILLFTIPVDAYNREPKGMDGWAWGTPAAQVAGVLAFSENIAQIPGAKAYKRTDIKCSYLGGGWQSQLHIFLEGKYVAVLLNSSIPSTTHTAQTLMNSEHGKPVISEENNGVQISFWAGALSSIMLIATYEGKDKGVSIVIGTPEFLIKFITAMKLQLDGSKA